MLILASPQQEARLPQDPGPTSNHAFAVLLILAAIFFLSFEGLRPPSPKPASAPSAEFSATRAREILNRLLGDGIPHPTGSAQNDVVRGRILDEFSNAGYLTTVQTGFACYEQGDCGTVQNVLARLEGTEPAGPTVLLAAHYDSVPAGPGAFDDGVGAGGGLAIAFTCKSLPHPRHSIIFLIDDGEEAGLLGARVFVNQHPWAKEVRAVVNVDSRGTSGPSLMFETGDANQWAVRLFAQHAAHPVTSSVFYTAYKQIPNDTDFTVFKAAGYQGLNFANIRDVVHYHTPLDNFENADPATLQHHGDNALSSLQAFANADISNPAKSEAVYFDLLGSWTIRWPATRTVAIALSAAFLLLLEIAWIFYKKRLTGPEFLWGFLAWPISIIAVAIFACLLSYILRKAGAMPVLWTAHPNPAQAAFWSLAIALLSFTALRFASRAGFFGLWSGTWIWWALLSIILAARMPGISYVLLAATCAAALAGFLLIFRPTSSSLAAILPLAVSAIVGFPLALMLHQGFGGRALPLIAVLVGVLLSPWRRFSPTYNAPAASHSWPCPGLPPPRCCSHPSRPSSSPRSPPKLPSTSTCNTFRKRTPAIRNGSSIPPPLTCPNPFASPPIFAPRNRAPSRGFQTPHFLPPPRTSKSPHRPSRSWNPPSFPQSAATALCFVLNAAPPKLW